MSSSNNLRENLNNYLSRNEKNSIASDLKSKIFNLKSSILPGNVYSSVPLDENSHGNEWSELSVNDCCPKLSRIQRLVGFFICISLGIFFFCAAMFLLPFLLLKARKFSLLFTLGSLFLILSFSFLWGPFNHAKHLFSKERLLFTSTYFGTLFLTLYFALVRHSTPLTVFCSILQILALFWFLFSYVPGGYTGINFVTKLCSSSLSTTISKTLPV